MAGIVLPEGDNGPGLVLRADGVPSPCWWGTRSSPGTPCSAPPSHAGEHPPGGSGAGDLPGGKEKAPADGPAADALPLEGVPLQGNTQGVGHGLPPPAQLHSDMAGIVLLPGHEWATTLDREREYNYFLKDAMANG